MLRFEPSFMGLVATGLVVVSHEEYEYPSVGHLLHIRILQDFQVKESYSP